MRKISDKEQQIVYLEIEKSKINREKGRLVLSNSIFLYFLFMAVGIIGFVFNYFDAVMLNVIIVMGIVVLILGTMPYLLIVAREEKKINNFLKKLK